MKTISGLRVPEFQDFATIPSNWEDFANDVITVIGSKINVALSPVLSRLAAAESKITDLYTKVPTSKVKVVRYTGTTSDSGGLIVPHAAGWVPSILVCSAQVPGTINKGINVTVDGNSITAQEFRVFAWDVDTGSQSKNQTITVHCYLRD